MQSSVVLERYRSWIKWLGFCFLNLLLLVLVSVVTEAEDNSALIRDFPELTKRLLTDQPADFVIVIDKSGTMRHFWNPVKESLSLFISAIPDGDYLSLLAFGTDAKYLTTPTPVNSQTRDHLINEVGRIGSPEDQKTDLGRAIGKTLDELNRPGGSRLKFVFFLTDFVHEPSGGSQYRNANPDEEIWQMLVNRRKNEQHGNILQVFALLLPLGKQVGRDISLGKSVFPELEQVSVNQRTLLSWFERRKAEVARDKLRAIVQSDSKKAPLDIQRIYIRSDLLRRSCKIYASISPIKERIVKTSELSSLEPKIQVEGDGLKKTEFSLKSRQNISLEQPMEDFDILVAHTMYPRRRILRGSETGNISLILEGTQKLSPSEEILKLGLPVSTSFIVSSSFPLTIPYGYVPIGLLIVIVVLIAGGIISIIYYYRPEYISGKIAEISILGFGRPRAIQKSEKIKSIAIGDTTEEEGIRIPNTNWELLIKAFRPCGEIGKHRGIYARMEKGQAKSMYQGERYDITTSDWVRVYPGCIIEVGGKRITLG